MKVEPVGLADPVSHRFCLQRLVPALVQQGGTGILPSFLFVGEDDG
jgi:hypothetical protein